MCGLVFCKIFQYIVQIICRARDQNIQSPHNYHLHLFILFLLLFRKNITINNKIPNQSKEYVPMLSAQCSCQWTATQTFLLTFPLSENRRSRGLTFGRRTDAAFAFASQDAFLPLASQPRVCSWKYSLSSCLVRLFLSFPPWTTTPEIVD